VAARPDTTGERHTGTEIVGDATPTDAPLTGPFWQELGKRKRQERDAKIIITAADGQTGVGKTNFAVFLAKVCDTSAAGFRADEKATLDVHRFLELYDSVEKGSAVILDEAEQIDSRRSMKHENIDAARKWETRRVNQITGILTLPSPESLDTRMERLADYWINITARGSAKVYKKKIHPIKRNLYYKTLQLVTWPNLDSDPDYKTLVNMKDEMIDTSDGGENWVRRSDHEEEIERVREEVRRDERDAWIRNLKDSGMKGTEIAALPHVDLTQQRVNQIARGE
jgi:hypothetical protein